MNLTEVEALGDLLEAETDLQLQIMQSNLGVIVVKYISLLICFKGYYWSQSQTMAEYFNGWDVQTWSLDRVQWYGHDWNWIRYIESS